MIEIDPSPIVLITAPLLALLVYITRRGLSKNQFGAPGRWAWATYSTWSFSWWSATLSNFVFLGAAAFFFYESLSHGAEFFREPVHPMPRLTGAVVETADVQRSPESLAQCLAQLNSGQVYSTPQGHLRVVVRRGRGNGIIYIFEVSSSTGGSHFEVHRLSLNPFASWRRCLDPSDDGSGPGRWVEYQGGH